jgi:hypothetical protein
MTIGLATIGQLREIRANPSRALIESRMAESPRHRTLPSMFDEYHPDLLCQFYNSSLLSPVKRQEDVRIKTPPSSRRMSFSIFRHIFSRSYVPISEKTATSLNETQFDLESKGSDVSETSTLAGSEKPSFKADSRVVSDAIIGLSDGLTVPFALTAGLSALGDTKVVIYGGLAELIAGAISMGLGGYLGAKSEE